MHSDLNWTGPYLFTGKWWISSREMLLQAQLQCILAWALLTWLYSCSLRPEQWMCLCGSVRLSGDGSRRQQGDKRCVFQSRLPQNRKIGHKSHDSTWPHAQMSVEPSTASSHFKSSPNPVSLPLLTTHISILNLCLDAMWAALGKLKNLRNNGEYLWK